MTDEAAERLLARYSHFPHWDVLVDLVPLPLLIDAQLRSCWLYMAMAVESGRMQRVPGSFEHGSK